MTPQHTHSATERAATGPLAILAPQVKAGVRNGAVGAGKGGAS